MSRSRHQELELNFDGLTDALTNLVGTLILFVFLLLAVTGDKRSEAETPPAMAALWEQTGEVHSSAELTRRILDLQAELGDLEANTGALESEIESLRARAGELAKRAAAPGGKPQ